MRKFSTIPDSNKDEPRIKLNPGNPVKDVYILDVAPNGEKKLVKKETVNTDDLIQSHKDECDIKAIIARHSMMGTESQLADQGGMYVDLSKMPKNLMEVQQVLSNARTVYDALSPDVKKDYPDLETFLGNFGSIQAYQAFVNKYQKDKPGVAHEEGGKSDE